MDDNCLIFYDSSGVSAVFAIIGVIIGIIIAILLFICCLKPLIDKKKSEKTVHNTTQTVVHKTKTVINQTQSQNSSKFISLNSIKSRKISNKYNFCRFRDYNANQDSNNLEIYLLLNIFQEIIEQANKFNNLRFRCLYYISYMTINSLRDRVNLDDKQYDEYKVDIERRFNNFQEDFNMNCHYKLKRLINENPSSTTETLLQEFSPYAEELMNSFIFNETTRNQDIIRKYQSRFKSPDDYVEHVHMISNLKGKIEEEISGYMKQTGESSEDYSYSKVMDLYTAFLKSTISTANKAEIMTKIDEKFEKIRKDYEQDITDLLNSQEENFDRINSEAKKEKLKHGIKVLETIFAKEKSLDKKIVDISELDPDDFDRNEQKIEMEIENTLDDMNENDQMNVDDIMMTFRKNRQKLLDALNRQRNILNYREQMEKNDEMINENDTMVEKVITEYMYLPNDCKERIMLDNKSHNQQIKNQLLESKRRERYLLELKLLRESRQPESATEPTNSRRELADKLRQKMVKEFENRFRMKQEVILEKHREYQSQIIAKCQMEYEDASFFEKQKANALKKAYNGMEKNGQVNIVLEKLNNNEKQLREEIDKARLENEEEFRKILTQKKQRKIQEAEDKTKALKSINLPDVVVNSVTFDEKREIENIDDEIKEHKPLDYSYQEEIQKHHNKEIIDIITKSLKPVPETEELIRKANPKLPLSVLNQILKVSKKRGKSARRSTREMERESTTDIRLTSPPDTNDLVPVDPQESRRQRKKKKRRNRSTFDEDNENDEMYKYEEDEF